MRAATPNCTSACAAIDKQKKHYYSVLFADRDWWERVPQDSVQRCSDRDLEESDDLSD